VRLLYFCAAHHNINICIQHIPGITNEIADAISRFQDSRFRRLAPTANPILDSIPAWPAHAFTIASCNSTTMVLPSQHAELTNPD